MSCLAAQRPLALLLALICFGPIPCLASRWIDVGSVGPSTDKVMVDADSLQKADPFIIVDIMTLYAAPRVNAHNITLDRRIQKTAIDCARHTFIGIRTIGYLGDKFVGSSPETINWRSKAVPLESDNLTQRVYTLACGSGAVAAGAPNARPKLLTGSGIVLDRRGDVLTAAHVVNGCKGLAVKPLNSAPVPATLDAVDGKNDLAVLKTLGGVQVGEPARFRRQSSPVQLGEMVGVIGYPLVGILSAEPKATFGEVSSVAGMNNDYSLLQISAPLQPGNSGGPVLDSSGLVIGVAKSQASLALVAVVGNVPQNINFATRGEMAQIFLGAHGIDVQTGKVGRALSTQAIAASAERSTVLVGCLHP